VLAGRAGGCQQDSDHADADAARDSNASRNSHGQQPSEQVRTPCQGPCRCRFCRRCQVLADP